MTCGPYPKPSVPINAPNKWVKAHQDAESPPEDLSPAAHINIAVDKLAGDQQLLIQGSQAQQVPHYGPEDISIFLWGGKLHMIFNRRLKTINRKNMRCYIISKLNWMGEIFNLVDWNAFEGAMMGHRATQLTNMTKYIYCWQNCWA